jgi:hypothetical protein
MKTATKPFQFVTASYLTRIRNEKAVNLDELRQRIEHASDESIFYHTFHTLSRHHFITEGFSNDFAQWVLASLNRSELAERLGSLDIRDYTSLAELRGDLRRLMTDACEANPRDAQQTGFEPFYFCEAVAVTVRLPLEARTLAEFHDALPGLSHDTFYHHFIASRLRLQLGTNDFSLWLSDDLGEPELAQRVNHIDIYTNTLDTARQKLMSLVEEGLNS